MANDIKRYDVMYNGEFHEDSTGEVVMYEDHAAIVERLRAELAKVTSSRDGWHAQACKDAAELAAQSAALREAQELNRIAALELTQKDAALRRIGNVCASEWDDPLQVAQDIASEALAATSSIPSEQNAGVTHPENVLMQALHDPENQPSQFGTHPSDYVDRMRDLLRQMVDNSRCDCTFPSDSCCVPARAAAFLAAGVTQDAKGDGT